MKTLVKVGNKTLERISYICIQCEKEPLSYLTAVEDKEDHRTICYKCIFADVDLIDHFKAKIAKFKYLRQGG